MPFASTISAVAAFAEDLEISDLIEYYGGAVAIADQYEQWGDRIHATIEVDFIEDLYRVAVGNGDPLFWYLCSRIGAGVGFCDAWAWDHAGILYREAIADGRMI